MAKYRVNCESDFCPVCVSCHNEYRSLEKFLFPCEHVCICSQCLITSRPKRCPLCQEHIQKILDHNGYEHEEYWKWVEEVKPAISTKFLQQFVAQSKIEIRNKMSYHRPHRNHDDLVSVSQAKFISKPQSQQQR
eukprot:CCRYP_018598-RA/>CCRYP_018598-RA protein AED:0.00 eAED:0.00 QI:73/1/0.5/1/0/0/2/0/133